MHIDRLARHAQEILQVLPHPQAALLPLIQLVLRDEGALDQETCSALAKICSVSTEQAHEVAEAFQSSQARPRDSLQVCDDLICRLNGSREVYSSLKKSCSAGTPAVLVSCPGFCHSAPVIKKPDGTVCKAVQTGRPGDSENLTPSAQQGAGSSANLDWK